MGAAAVLGFATAIAVYILIVYPLLLALLPQRAKPLIQKRLGFQPRVTVLLAVYNGGRYLRQKLESILLLDYPRSQLEILVVSDGSTDETAAIAKELSGKGIELIECEHQGKAGALNAAIPHATGEILFFTRRLHPQHGRHVQVPKDVTHTAVKRCRVDSRRGYPARSRCGHRAKDLPIARVG